MSERPESVRRRRAVIDEIGDVVGALRAIAAAHSTEAQGALDAIAVYERHVAAALMRLAAPVTSPGANGPGVTVVVGAAQGFCGGYPARVAEAALKLVPHRSGLLVIGRRTEAMLAYAGVSPAWSADLPSATRFVPALASAVTDAVLDLSDSHPGPIAALSGADRPGLPIETRRIWPPERSGTAPAAGAPSTPLTTLPSAVLVRSLLAETLFVELARTILHGLQAENRARIEAMARAQSNLKIRRAEVDHRYRQARQEQMTTEVIELSTGGQSAAL